MPLEHFNGSRTTLGESSTTTTQATVKQLNKLKLEDLTQQLLKELAEEAPTSQGEPTWARQAKELIEEINRDDSSQIIALAKTLTNTDPALEEEETPIPEGVKNLAQAIKDTNDTYQSLSKSLIKETTAPTPAREGKLGKLEKFKQLFIDQKMTGALIDLPTEAMAVADMVLGVCQSKPQDKIDINYKEFFEKVSAAINVESWFFDIELNAKLESVTGVDAQRREYTKIAEKNREDFCHTAYDTALAYIKEKHSGVGVTNPTKEDFENYKLAAEKHIIKETKPDGTIEVTYPAANNSHAKDEVGYNASPHIFIYGENGEFLGIRTRQASTCKGDKEHNVNRGLSKARLQADITFIKEQSLKNKKQSLKDLAKKLKGLVAEEDLFATFGDGDTQQKAKEQIQDLIQEIDSNDDDDHSQIIALATTLTETLSGAEKSETKDVMTLKKLAESIKDSEAKESVYIVRLTSLEDSKLVKKVPKRVGLKYNYQRETAKAELASIEEINKDYLENWDDSTPPPRLAHFMQMNINEWGENLQNAPKTGSVEAKQAFLHNELAMLSTLYDNRHQSDIQGERCIEAAYKDALEIYKKYVNGHLRLAAACNKMQKQEGQKKGRLKTLANKLKLFNPAIIDGLSGEKLTFYTLVKQLSLPGNGYLKPENTWLSSALANSLHKYSASGCKSAMDRWKDWDESVRALQLTNKQTGSVSSPSSQIPTFATWKNKQKVYIKGHCTPAKLKSELAKHGEQHTQADCKGAIRDGYQPNKLKPKSMFWSINSPMAYAVAGTSFLGVAAIGGAAAFIALSLACPPVTVAAIAAATVAVAVVLYLRNKSFDTNYSSIFNTGKDIANQEKSNARKLAKDHEPAKIENDIEALLKKHNMSYIGEDPMLSNHLGSFRLHRCLKEFFEAPPTKPGVETIQHEKLKERLKVIDPKLVPKVIDRELKDDGASSSAPEPGTERTIFDIIVTAKDANFPPDKPHSGKYQENPCTRRRAAAESAAAESATAPLLGQSPQPQ